MCCTSCCFPVHLQHEIIIVGYPISSVGLSACGKHTLVQRCNGGRDAVPHLTLIRAERVPIRGIQRQFWWGRYIAPCTCLCGKVGSCCPGNLGKGALHLLTCLALTDLSKVVLCLVSQSSQFFSITSLYSSFFQMHRVAAAAALRCCAAAGLGRERRE